MLITLKVIYFLTKCLSFFLKFRLAEEALLQEARRGAERAEMYGPSGWLRPKLPPTNKRFLHNMLSGKEMQ